MTQSSTRLRASRGEPASETPEQLEIEQLRLRVANAERLWRRTFDAVDAAMVMVDEAGLVRRLNRRAARIAPAARGQLIGASLTAALGDAEPWLTADALLKHVIVTGEAASDQVADGTRARWLVSVAPLGVSEGPTGVADDLHLILVRDELKLAELQVALQERAVAAAVEQIVAGVAHEVRNPLFGISATLEAFQSRFGADPRHEPYLSVMRSTLDRMTGLMRDLVEYGRPPIPALGLEPLAPVLLSAQAECMETAKARGVEIDCHTESESASVWMDPVRLRRAVACIIENAVQHAPPGTTVGVRTSFSPCGAWQCCSVRDRGAGFRVADLPHVFEPFFAHRPGGTGLGLAIARRIVDQHGGYLSAANAHDGGATVTLHLPLGREAQR